MISKLILPISCILLLLIGTTTVFGQLAKKRTTMLEPLPIPPITIEPVENIDKPIELTSMHIDSEILGHLAQTTITMSFYNPNQRIIAADFIFPIPAYSVINGYALDVNGVMVDGVAVEKKKARVTFDKIVRQGVDPGLVEKVQGNVFKTRIFPLTSGQKRTIKIHLSSILSNNNDVFNYDVPLMIGQKIGQFSFDLKAINVSAEPILTSSDFSGLAFNTWQNQYVTSFQQKDFILTDALSLQVPVLKKQAAIIGKNSKNAYYFSVNDVNPESKIKQSLPTWENIQIVWDASHSRFGQDHKKELDFLQTFFRFQPNLEVSLFTLRNELRQGQIFNIKNGDWRQLRQHLMSIQYDGATNLSALNHLPKLKSLDALLLFSDTLHTFAEKQPIDVSAPLYVISNDITANFAYAEQLAQFHHGQAFQIFAKNDFVKMVKNLHQPVRQLIDVEVIKGRVDQLPQTPLKSSSNHQVIGGQLLSDTAELKLKYGHSGQVMDTVIIKLSKKEALTSDLPEYIWAQKRLELWQKDTQSHKQKIITLSKKYGFVSDFTSLLVLENLEQYVEHKIVPPLSLINMRKGYFQAMKVKKKMVNDAKVNKIDQVIAQWELRKQWWQKTFPKYINKKPVVQTPRSRALNGATETEEMDSMTVTGSNMSGVDLEGEIAVTTAAREAPMSPVMDATVDDSMEAKKQGNKMGTNATVKISAWDPETPYLKALKREQKHARAALYYDLKKTYHNSPAFYFDSADFFLKNQQQDFGLQVLSNIAELKIQDSRLLRTMAMKLKEYNYIDLSIDAYRQVLADREEEPQSLRDLALALQIRAQKNNIRADYQQAIELLYQVITTEWDRFNGIEVTALMEINQMMPQLNKHKIDYSFIDKRFIAALDVDVRIVMGWDSDMTDIDLWVIEPNGEKVNYSHKLSAVGGMFHQDFTGGYGPEEYLIKTAPKGDYQIRVHFYGNNSPELSGATTLYVDVFTNFGRMNQKKQTMALRLEKSNDDYDVGTVSIDI